MNGREKLVLVRSVMRRAALCAASRVCWVIVCGALLIGEVAVGQTAAAAPSDVGSPDQPAGQPFVFGVMADIQYGDKPDHLKRHYRTALARLDECVADLNQRKPAFVIQLGDIVDGYDDDQARSNKDLDTVLPKLGQLTMPVYHVIGNHCMHVGAAALHDKLGLERFYYDFTVPGAAGWRFVVLDGNDAGYGVVSDEQLAWFRRTLKEAKARDERVICFCHFALTKEAAAHHRMNKPAPVLAAIDEAGCVAAWFAGHDHQGGYARRKGVHHVTVKGIVEAPETNAYALVELYPDRIREIGFGSEPSRELPLAQRAAAVGASQ